MGPESYKPKPEAVIVKKPDNLGQVEAAKAIEFPKNLEDRFNAVLNIINSENKSSAIGWYLDEKWRTSYGIGEIAKSYLSPSVKAPTATAYQEYCTQTFIPIGAVAEEKTIVKGKTNPVSHYRLTEDGEKYARPIARFALKTAVENGISMHEIFGHTSSSGDTRSPYNRARIMFLLQKEACLTDSELVNRLGLYSQNITSHLLKLKEAGLLNYDSVSSEESGWAKYKWECEKNPEDVATVKYRLNLTRKVAQKMQEVGIADYKEVADALNKEHPSELSIVLTGLERQGFIQKIGRFGYAKKSEASITEKGRGLTFINTIFESLKNDDLSAINKEIEIFNDNSVSGRYIIRASNLYGNVSPYSKKLPREDNKLAILSILKNQRLRFEQINKILGKKSTRYLGELLQSGEIKKEVEGRAAYYSINPKN